VIIKYQEKLKANWKGGVAGTIENVKNTREFKLFSLLSFIFIAPTKNKTLIEVE
jgi:hypothetical protein